MADRITLEDLAATSADKRRQARSGSVPAVIHGTSSGPKTIAVDEKVLVRHLMSGSFMTSVVMIEGGGKRLTTIPKNVSLDPITDRPVHVDFLRISENASVHVVVPVNFVDEDSSPGLAEGGLLNIARHEVEIVSEASRIPDEILVSLRGLKLGDVVRASSLMLPDGAILAEDGDPVIAAISAAERHDALSDQPRAVMEKVSPEEDHPVRVVYHDTWDFETGLQGRDAWREVHVVRNREARSAEIADDLLLASAADAVRESFARLLGAPSDHLSYVVRTVRESLEGSGVQ